MHAAGEFAWNSSEEYLWPFNTYILALTSSLKSSASQRLFFTKEAAFLDTPNYVPFSAWHLNV